MVANTPQSRKAKGRKFQQECRDNIIRSCDIEPLDILSTAMGQNGPDLYLAKEARKKFPYAVECKNQETLNIWQALQQAQDNADIYNLTPILFFKRARSETYAVLKMSDFLELMSELNSYRYD